MIHPERDSILLITRDSQEVKEVTLREVQRKLATSKLIGARERLVLCSLQNTESGNIGHANGVPGNPKKLGLTELFKPGIGTNSFEFCILSDGTLKFC